MTHAQMGVDVGIAMREAAVGAMVVPVGVVVGEAMGVAVVVGVAACVAVPAGCCQWQVSEAQCDYA